MAPAPPDEQSLGNIVKREMLAGWYLAADKAWVTSRAGASPEKTRRANDLFDTATLAFLRFAIPDAVLTLRTMYDELSGGATPANEPLCAMTVEPRIWVKSDIPSLTFGISTLVPATTNEKRKLTLVATNTDGKSVRTSITLDLLVGVMATLNKTDGAFSTQISTLVEEGKPTYLSISLMDRARTLASDWVVAVPQSLVTSHDSNAEKLKAFVAGTPASEQSPQMTLARHIFTSRNGLLTDSPSRSVSAQFLATYASLPTQLQSELTTLTSGQSPYPLEGSWWLSCKLGNAGCPMWVSAPPAASRSKPMPLLVLLHGMGGDESQFEYGYGGGAVVDGAVARGMIVVSPSTMNIMTSPAAFDSLVATMGQLYPVDPTRIYIIGHSMGAGAASSLAQTRAKSIAAAVCFAGGQFDSKKPACPTLVFAGQIDPIIPLEKMKPGIEKAAAAGLKIELREKANYGHTLIVGDFANEALDYLESHRAPGTK